MCSNCVIRSICDDGDVCRFRRCRVCGLPMADLGLGRLLCSMCDSGKRVVRLRRNRELHFGELRGIVAR